MKIVVPYLGALPDLDTRMIRLAEALGISCVTFPLTPVAEQIVYPQSRSPSEGSCLVVNPQVMKEWIGLNGVPSRLVTSLLSRFSHVVVHGLCADPFDSELVAAFSRNRLQSVRKIDGTDSAYNVASDSEDICSAFSGLSFGPLNLDNDHVFSVGATGPPLRPLISIGGDPFMALLTECGTEILFVASKDIAELDAKAESMDEAFSKLVPLAMALRYVAGDECWRPGKSCASLMIDDPPLRKRYGFLDFDSLLALSERHRYHATIAFIPRNYRRSSASTVRLFVEHADRLSVCFHGNDHTKAEFASTDPHFLDTALRIAEERMTIHHRMTNIPCGKVMVFPQEKYSVEAMRALKQHDYCAVVSGTPPRHSRSDDLKIRDLIQPATLRYSGFPLFHRQQAQRVRDRDVAFNVFFGQPVLIRVHHEAFQCPESLTAVIGLINSVASELEWCDVASAVCTSFLVRRYPSGTHHIRAYSNTVQISNESDHARQYVLEWAGPADGVTIDKILMDGAPYSDIDVDDIGVRLSFELAPRCTHTCSIVHQNPHATIGDMGFRWNAKAFMRRRLSECRDNYLSKNRHLLLLAKAIHRCFPG